MNALSIQPVRKQLSFDYLTYGIFRLKAAVFPPWHTNFWEVEYASHIVTIRKIIVVSRLNLLAVTNMFELLAMTMTNISSST